MPARAVALDRAAEGGDPLAHAGQTRSLRPRAAAAVVGHLEHDVRRLDADADGGVPGIGVAHDVGHRLAQRQRQGRLVRDRQRGEVGLDRGLDAGRRQRPPRAVQLAAQPLGPIADHGGPHLGQRLAPDPLDVPHLVAGPRRLALRQPRGQLGLQDDHRQGVAEQVVQVARDALPLGERREPLDLLVGPRRRRCGPLRAPRRRCSRRRSRS